MSPGVHGRERGKFPNRAGKLSLGEVLSIMVLLQLWAYRDFKHSWCYGMEQVCGLDAAVAAALPCTTYGSREARPGSGEARPSAWVARRYRKDGTAHGQCFLIFPIPGASPTAPGSAIRLISTAASTSPSPWGSCPRCAPMVRPWTGKPKGWEGRSWESLPSRWPIVAIRGEGRSHGTGRPAPEAGKGEHTGG